MATNEIDPVADDPDRACACRRSFGGARTDESATVFTMRKRAASLEGGDRGVSARVLPSAARSGTETRQELEAPELAPTGSAALALQATLKLRLPWTTT